YSAADGVHVDDISEILNVGHYEIFLVCCVSLDGRRKWHAFYAAAVAQQFVGPALAPPFYVGVSGPAIGRVVLEASVCRWVVRRRDDNAVGEMLFPILVI